MKNLILIISTILIFVGTSFSTSSPTKLISNTVVEATFDSESGKNYILFSSYDTENKMMDFILKNPVTMVQIYNEDGSLEMMVPIMSDEVSLGLTQFRKGKYRIGFLLEGVDTPQFMDLNVK